MRVVVVGAGLGGLSAACHLAGRGHDVTVVEREALPGGRAGRLDLGGYRFDTGPTVLTMPDLLAEAFAAAGAELDDFVRLTPLDPMYRACFADGSTIHVRPGRAAMTEEIRATCGPADAAAFDRFCDWLGDLYELELGSFIDRNYDSPLDLVRPLGPALRLLQLGGLRKLSTVVGSYFDDERLRRLFSFQAMYAGLAPYQALALYGVITYMDTVGGVFVAEGGVHAVSAGLAAAAEKAGATFRYGTEVRRISVGRVELADGEVLRTDAIVCNADLPVAYEQLLGRRPPRTARRYSPSAMVVHLGVRGSLPDGAAHHNIHFGAAWEGAFQALLDDGVRMPDPSILVTSPTVSDPTAAPEGGHVLYALEPVPNLDGRIDWSRERGPARDRLVGQLDRLGYPVADVDVEVVVDPTDWERQGMAKGTPFALAHTFLQSGPFRPGNVVERGIAMVGSGTTPGVGVPMVLLSGKLAAERVESWR